MPDHSDHGASKSGFFDSFDANEMGNGNGLRNVEMSGVEFLNMFVFFQLSVLLYIHIKLLLFYLVVYICFLA